MKLFRIALKAGLSTSLLSVLLACSGGGNNDDNVFQRPVVGIDFPPTVSATNGSSINIHALAVGVSSDVQSVQLQLNGNTEVTQTAAPDFFQYLLPIASLTEEDNVIGVTAFDANLSQSDFVGIARGSSWMLERGLQFDTSGARWLAVDGARKALLELDLDTGVKTVLSGGVAAVGSGDDLAIPEDMVIDNAAPSNRNRALIVDSELQAIVAIDLTTAARSIFSSATVPDANNVFATPVAIEITAAADIAYVLDADSLAIIAVDLASGTRTIIADNTSPGTANFIRPVDIALQESTGRLFVSDAGVSGIIAIDIGSGTRSIVSDAQTPSSDDIFLAIKNLAIAGDVLYVSDSGTDAITEVDLRASDNMVTPEIVFGARTVISASFDSSGAGVPDVNNPLRFPTALAVDSSSNHLLVIDNVLGVLAQVDLIDDAGMVTGTLKGERTYVVDGATTAATDSVPAAITSRTARGLVDQIFNITFYLESPQGLSSNANDTVLYVVDAESNGIIAFDPLSNFGSFIVDRSSNTVIDSNGGIAFTATGLLNAVDQMSLTAAVEGSYPAISVSNTGIGSGAEFTIAVNASNEISSFTVTTAGVDYAYGDQLTIAGADLGGSGSVTITLTDDFVRMIQPRTLVTEITSTDSITGFYIVDSALEQVLQMTIGGSLTVVSDSNATYPLRDPVATVLLDETLYVLDAELDEIVIVDLSDGAAGARSILTYAGGAEAFDSPAAMVLDSTGEKLLVAEESNHSLIEVTIADGTRAAVPNYSAAVNGLAGANIVDMLLDTAGEGTADDRLLMLDRGRSAVFPVDLTTGMVGSDITSPAVPAPPGGADPANVFVAPQSMVLNSNLDALYVFDEVLRSVYMVDLRLRDETDDDIDNAEIDPQRVMVVRGTALNK